MHSELYCGVVFYNSQLENLTFENLTLEKINFSTHPFVNHAEYLRNLSPKSIYRILKLPDFLRNISYERQGRPSLKTRKLRLQGFEDTFGFFFHRQNFNLYYTQISKILYKCI